jgi:NAD(P)-dependent dehydrogenase (short-subunit alcohol dehydrogenase family)
MGALDDRVAVITGAGCGLGREHALLLAAEGAKAVVDDLDGSGSDVQFDLDRIRCNRPRSARSGSAEPASRRDAASICSYSAAGVLGGWRRGLVRTAWQFRSWASLTGAPEHGPFCPAPAYA